MVVTLSLRARQGKAGSALVLDGYQLSSDLADSPNVFIGTTNTSTPPATFSAFAHVENRDLRYSWWDRSTDRSSSTASAGTIVQFADRQSSRKVLPLDANFAAGKYLWLADFASATPAGGDAPLSVEGPYLIR